MIVIEASVAIKVICCTLQG